MLSKLVFLAISRELRKLDDITHATYLGILSWTNRLGCAKNCRCLLYSMMVLPPSLTMFRFIKLDLIQFQTTNNQYVLKLKCSSLKERGVMGCRELIGTFLMNYIFRPITLIPIMKYTIVGSPRLSVTWIVKIPSWKEDMHTDFRANLIKENWNGKYDEFWHAKEIKPNSCLSIFRKLMGGFSMKPFLSRKTKHQIAQSCEVDDVVFAKFSEGDASPQSVRPSMIIIVLGVGLLISIVLFFFVIRFVFHQIGFFRQ